MGRSRGMGRRISAALVTTVFTTGILAIGIPPAAAATVVVNQNHERGWQKQHTVCTGSDDQNTGDQRFVAGPQGPPGAEGNQPEAPVDSDSPTGSPPGPSAGSLEMTTGDNGWSVELFRNVHYDGVALDDIESMNYWTYEDPSVATDASGLPTLGYVPAIYIWLKIDKNGSAAGGLDTLVFEPAYQETDGQHDVDPAAWQKWIADDPDTTGPEGKWWLASVGQAVETMKSLDQWTPESGPEWTIVNEGDWGGVILGAGCGEPEPWGEFIGNTDRFTIDVKGAGGAVTSTTYDFEPGSPADATVLDCEPETDSNPTKTSHTVTCTATNSEGVPIPESDIDVEATGANDPDGGDSKELPDFGCVTDDAGECSFTHGPSGTPPIATNNPGTTTYTAWLDIDEDNSTVEADKSEARDEIAGKGDDREPDGTDVVEKVWVARIASGLDAEPETGRGGLGEEHTITATVFDQFGDLYPATTTIKFEFFQGSPSDADGNSPETPDKTCTTSNESSCSITYTQTTATGTDLICAFTNADPAMSGQTCSGESRSDSDDQDDATDPPAPADDDQDVVSKTWVQPEATRLDCEPESAEGPTGSAHQVTCTARSSRDVFVPFVNIDAEATGANDPDGDDSRGSPDFTCTTNSSGTCSYVHGPTGGGTSSNAGRTIYRSWIDRSMNDGPSEADGSEERNEATNAGAAEPDDTDVTEMTWKSSPLECEPETSSTPTERPHSIECSAAAGSNIDVEITGANDPDNGDTPNTPDLTCVVGPTGRCTLTNPSGGAGSATTDDAGVALYRAWVDSDGSNATNESDATEGRDEITTPGSIPETDSTDVVERTWTEDPVGQCNDGLDNDGDGFVDFPRDPGCGSATDSDESNPQPDPDPDPEPEPTCPGYRNDPRNQVVGTSANDTLVGTSGRDIICGLGGDDDLTGGGDNDVIIGGRGHDTARGRAGTDTLKGSFGKDLLFGGGGPDHISGGAGRDSISGGRGRDSCVGGRGQDVISRCE